MEFDTLDVSDNTSQTAMYAVPVTPSSLCVLRLTLVERSSGAGAEGGQHKLSLRGLAVTATYEVDAEMAVHGHTPRDIKWPA